MAEKNFVQGITFKKFKFDNGGEVIKVGVKVEDFIKYVMENQQGEWLNYDIKTSKNDPDKVYAELNTYTKG